jgi:hypothetical protein
MLLMSCVMRDVTRHSSSQLCINFTNERLAKGFVDVVFKREQAEYLSEGVPWEPIVYVAAPRCNCIHVAINTQIFFVVCLPHPPPQLQGQRPLRRDDLRQSGRPQVLVYVQHT